MEAHSRFDRSKAKEAFFVASAGWRQRETDKPKRTRGGGWELVHQSGMHMNIRRQPVMVEVDPQCRWRLPLAAVQGSVVWTFHLKVEPPKCPLSWQSIGSFLRGTHGPSFTNSAGPDRQEAAAEEHKNDGISSLSCLGKLRCLASPLRLLCCFIPFTLTFNIFITISPCVCSSINRNKLLQDKTQKAYLVISHEPGPLNVLRDPHYPNLHPRILVG